MINLGADYRIRMFRNSTIEPWPRKCRNPLSGRLVLCFNPHRAAERARRTRMAEPTWMSGPRPVGVV